MDKRAVILVTGECEDQHSAVSTQHLVFSRWGIGDLQLAQFAIRNSLKNHFRIRCSFESAGIGLRAVFVDRRTKRVFLFLVLTQAAHSAEEYFAKLYEVFAPARMVSSLVSDNLALGFLVANAALVTFGLWCWAFPVRQGWKAAGVLAWFWGLLELGNGVGHTGLAIARKGYFPGVLTAPLLLLLAGWLVLCVSGRRNGYTVSNRVVER